MLVHTADSLTPARKPISYGIWQAALQAESEATLSELVFSFADTLAFGPRRRDIWGWPPLNSP